ncbi:MAG: aldehyde dehydrogenase family protein [Proteobacteria bacterium]|nr:aldehyde dehydrogenase family protein [Pseudomonadota bacterium]
MTIQEKFESMEYGPAPENAARVNEWLDENGRKFGHFIDGRMVRPKGAETFDTKSPSTGENMAAISQATSREVDKAVSAARKAQPGWAALGGHGRARYLYALARLVQKHSRKLAVLESMENGKPIRETRDIDIPLVARHFYHHAGWAQLIDQEFPGYEAVGVVGQIIPWNFPLLMLAWKIAPALAAGNTVVLKPAEFTSLTALMMADLLMEAGLPPGVVNFITGDGRVGQMLVDHPGIDKLAFTGSTDVGRIIRESTAGTGKKLTLELGGKSPFIVFEDADLDSAVEGLVDAIWLNAGQVCCAGSRLLIQEGVEDRFITKVKSRMEKLRIGPSLDKCIDIGAIVDEVQRQRIDAIVQQGKKEGASVWQPDCALPTEGVYYRPTLMTGVETSNVAAREEIFGPVVVSMTFRTQKEAVALANNTRYGLAASIWTENINRSLEIAPQLKAGVVWINSTNLFDAAVGFGGYRESGFGREGGIEGMYQYLKPAFYKKLKPAVNMPLPKVTESREPGAGDGLPALDQTAKQYIGGKQARPDGGNSIEIPDHEGRLAGIVGDGNYKDIRNAVEAAAAAGSWASAAGHLRAQIIYFIAENLSYRAREFETRLKTLTGASAKGAAREVARSIDRLFTYAAWADKFEGRVHSPPMRGVALAMNEPVGIIGIACPDEAPLLAFVSLMAPAIAMGNRVVMLPSQRYPLLATDFYQILETSDVPAGVVNIVTANRDDLAVVLAKHDNVDGLWFHGGTEASAEIERQAGGNMKRVWTSGDKAYDWFDTEQGEGRHILRHATEVKNIWIPYGDQT